MPVHPSNPASWLRQLRLPSPPPLDAGPPESRLDPRSYAFQTACGEAIPPSCTPVWSRAWCRAQSTQDPLLLMVLEALLLMELESLLLMVLEAAEMQQ
jgi:hypothetical protein